MTNESLTDASKNNETEEVLDKKERGNEKNKQEKVKPTINP